MELTGIVVFILSNIDSKSEGFFPYLYTGNAGFVKILKDDDEPFTFPILKAFDMKLVKVIGEYNDNETFIVTEIVEKDNLVEEETKEQEEVEAKPVVNEPETVEVKEEID